MERLSSGQACLPYGAISSGKQIRARIKLSDAAEEPPLLLGTTAGTAAEP
jgi:hypothetical protein